MPVGTEDSKGRQIQPTIQVIDYVLYANSEVQVKWAEISASTTGVTEVVKEVTGKELLILAFQYVVNAAVEVNLQDDAGTPVVIGGVGRHGGQGEGRVVAFYPTGVGKGTSGQAIDINLSADVAVGGSLVYCEI